MYRCIITLSLAALLVACGGGGSSTEDTPEQPQQHIPEVNLPRDHADALNFHASPKVDALFTAWNPNDQDAALRPGTKIMFFGKAQGCERGTQGPTEASTQRWTPIGKADGCDTQAQDRQGASEVVAGDDAVKMLTTSGRQADGVMPFFGPFDAAGQNGAGANAHIVGTFFALRQAWYAEDPLQPWANNAKARVRSEQSMNAAQVADADTTQAKQQISATFLNRTCMKEIEGRLCQVDYLFNTSIVRSGVSDWNKVRWFQTGNIWFDPAQGGIPIIDGPLLNNGVSTNDEGTGVSLFTSQGAASQHATFQNQVFDATVSFEQLCNALRVIAGRKLNMNWAQVTDAQMAQVWGSAWNQREEWVFVSGIIGQEVYNPTEQRVQIDGSFKSLYVGPQF